MLALDALRMQRLKAWPESDTLPADAPATIADGEAVVLDDATAVSEAVAMAEPSPPPPAPAMMLSRDAPGGGEGARAADAMAPEEPTAERKAAIANSGERPAGISTSAQIEPAPWNPDTPYLAKLKAAANPYQAYLLERRSQGNTPAFFLDCADYFRDQAKDPKLALRVLSNIAEIDLESAPLVRVLAYRLAHWERFDLAIPLFEEALKLRGEEPQSRRDLALALSRAAEPDWARAVSLLWEVVSRPWDGRFPEIELIALHELNDILARMPDAARSTLDLDALHIPPDFLKPIAVDLRVVLSWDADNTDIDLWVIDPSGETAIYSHPQTTTGGQVSRDFTGGYGPEVYTIKRALPGTYIVKTHYFGDRQQKLTGAVTVQLEFLTRFNNGESARQAVTRRLEGDNEQIEIGRFKVEAP